MPLVFGVVWALLIGELLLALAVRAREARIVRTVLHREHGGQRAKLATAFVLFLVSIVAFVGRADFPLAWSLTTIGLTALAAAVVPAGADTVCGFEGVRNGWSVHALDDLEEWRLGGRHFRYRIGDQWRAIPLPEGEQPRLAEELARRIPDRESEFR